MGGIEIRPHTQQATRLASLTPYLTLFKLDKWRARSSVEEQPAHNR